MDKFITISEKDSETINGGFLNFGSTSVAQVQSAAVTLGANNVNIGQTGLSLLSFNTGAIYN